MKGPVFTVDIITPLERFQRRVRHMRLTDGSGHFGLLAGHGDFVTSFGHCLGYYTAEDGTEMYMAVEGGVLGVRGGVYRIATRAFFESADAGMLSGIIEEEFQKKDRYEAAISRMLEGIERAFLQKTAEMERQGGAA